MYKKKTDLTALLLLALSVLAGCVARPLEPTFSGDASHKLAYPEDRISDQVIHHDEVVYDDTQARIKALNDGGIPIKDYYLSKAQCWLDVSFHEYSRNDHGGFPQAALNESQEILSMLEQHQQPSNQTRLVNGAKRLRPDLWEAFKGLKQHPEFMCAAQSIACGEVELVHAGNEMHDAGWRHAKPYIQIAEDYKNNATAAAEQCAISQAEIKSKPLVFSGNALFHFNGWRLDDMLPGGQDELINLAREIQAIPHVTELTIIGYTDRVGSVAYNKKLSLKRAHTVRALLQAQGVTIPIKVENQGKNYPTVFCRNVRPTNKLIQCLQPNRRVEINILQHP